jgi:hypothetical protein
MRKFIFDFLSEWEQTWHSPSHRCQWDR